MTDCFKEKLLNEEIAKLELSRDFKLVSELLGFYTLSDLVRQDSSSLRKLPGFTQQLLFEYVYFLEKNKLGHYVDPE
nr:hypothetical protein [uncultured Pedobacter sp.]